MTGKLTVAEAVQKTTKTGRPYLNVKSDKNKYYSIWDDNQHIWHLFEVGATLEVEVVQNGAFSNIIGVAGVPDQNGGLPSVTNKAFTPSPALDKFADILQRIEKKLDFLVEEKRVLNSTIAMGTLPKLEDIPVVNLDEKDEIDVEKLPL